MEKPEVYVVREGELRSFGVYTHAPASIYLIDTSEESFLVDVGSRVDGKLIKEENEPIRYEPFLKEWLNKIGYNPSDISGIILTHNHPDHANLQNAILSDVDAYTLVYAPDSLYRLFDRNDNYQQPLEDGTEIAPGVKVIKLPGHESSLDQGVLVDTEEGLTAIVGDTFLRLSEYNAPNDFHLWPPNDEKLALESRKKIIDLNPKRVAPGHGPMFYV